jgi:hypothetical protein
LAKGVKGFQKGNKGKPKGAVNNLTKSVRESVLFAFNELQKDKEANLLAWAKDSPTEFYKIASKLIPTEINASVITVGKDIEENYE